jgi:energy-coupling factor transporter transmembrane protein EcfT
MDEPCSSEMHSSRLPEPWGKHPFLASSILQVIIIYESGRGFSWKTPDLKPVCYFFLVFAGLLVLEVFVAVFLAAAFLVATFLTSFPWSRCREPLPSPGSLTLLLFFVLLLFYRPQFLFLQPKVMANLMEHNLSHPLFHLLLISADPLDGALIDYDLVR